MTRAIPLFTALLVLLSFYLPQLQANDAIQFSSKASLISRASFALSRAESLSKDTVNLLVSDTEFHLGKSDIKQRSTRIWYFPSDTSVQNFGYDVVSYDDFNSRVAIKTVGTLKADGKFIPVSPSAYQTRDSNSYNTFTNHKEIIIPFSSLEVGDVAIIEYERTIDRSKLELGWSRQIYHQFQYPIFNYSLKFLNHKDSKIYWKNQSSFVSCSEDGLHVHCTSEFIPKFQSDPDVQWYDEIPFVSISEIDSWNELINSVRNKVQAAQSDSDQVEATVEELTKNVDSVESKIHNIFNFVSQKIRYVSVSKNGHAYTPHSVDSTLKNLYGDCKDKSTLLANMLELAGVPADLVLVSTKRMDISLIDLPMASVFDHMIVCLELNDRTYCLDPTDASQAWFSPPSSLYNNIGLWLLNGEEPMNLPKSPYKWMHSLKTMFEISPEGDILEGQVREYLHSYAASYRRFLQPKSPEERDRWVVENYEESVAKANKIDVDVSNLDDVLLPLSISTNAIYEGVFDLSTSINYREKDSYLIEELSSSYQKNRSYKSFYSGVDIRSVYTFALPPGKFSAIDEASSLFLDHKFGRMERKFYRSKVGEVVFDTRLRIPSRYIAPGESATFNEMLDVFIEESTMWIYAEKSN